MSIYLNYGYVRRLLYPYNIGVGRRGIDARFKADIEPVKTGTVSLVRIAFVSAVIRERRTAVRIGNGNIDIPLPVFGQGYKFQKVVRLVVEHPPLADRCGNFKRKLFDIPAYGRL